MSKRSGNGALGRSGGRSGVVRGSAVKGGGDSCPATDKKYSVGRLVPEGVYDDTSKAQELFSGFRKKVREYLAQEGAVVIAGTTYYDNSVYHVNGLTAILDYHMDGLRLFGTKKAVRAGIEKICSSVPDLEVDSVKPM